MTNDRQDEGTSPKIAPFAKIALFIAFIALFFIAAGTLRWLEAWIFLGFFLAATMGLVIWLRKHDPSLLKERMSVKQDVKKWDKTIIRLYSGLLFIMWLIAPFDAIRFSWSHVPRALQGIAFLILFLSALIIFWAFRENTFLSELVRIQTDRGHKVCASGPYSFVRHPMYLAVILIVLCLPLFLGSFYALLPAALIAALFVLRTSLEDKTLRHELPGYTEYAEKVRWKLVPGIW